MAALDGLAEVAGAAVEAESTARSVTWQDAAAIDAALTRVAKNLTRDRESLGRPNISAVAASPSWQHRLADMVDPESGRLGREPARRTRSTRPPRRRPTPTPLSRWPGWR